MNTNEAKAPITILLVENDPEIYEHMKRFLKELGYTVALATNEDDSLRLTSSAPNRLAAGQEEGAGSRP